MKAKVQLARAGVLAGILLFWQYAPKYNIISPYVLTPLSQVLASLPELNNPKNVDVPHGGLLPNLYLTVSEVVVAFALSVLIGLTIGFLIGYYKRVGDAYEPLVYVFHAIPAFILYPILFLSLGFGFDSKVAFALILGVFPLVINTAAGLRQTKENYVRMAKSLGATDNQILLRVLLPSAGPNIMSGIRISLGAVVIAVIAGEIIASNAGLGRIIDNTNQTLQISQMYATILIVVGLAYGLYVLTTIIERRVIPYEKK